MADEVQKYYFNRLYLLAHCRLMCLLRICPLRLI